MTAAEPGVYAVRFARADATRSDIYLRNRLYGEPETPVTLDFYFWVIVHPEGVILFDTGFDDRYPVPMALDFEGSLAMLGLHADDVDTVVVSHLHSDHTGNLPHLRRARFLVSEEEWHFWFGHMGRRGLFGKEMLGAYLDDFAAAERDGRVQLTAPQTRIAAGVTTQPATGHTTASQILLVESPRERIALASDALHFYEQLHTDRPFAITCNVAETYASFDMLRALERDDIAIVPGHDPAVANNYPRVDGGEGIGAAVRILDLSDTKPVKEQL